MKVVSDRWLPAITGSHRVATIARVFDPVGDWTDVPLVEGTVTLDATAAVRGRCDLTVEDADWLPVGTDDRLAPYGSEINLRRGVVFPDGSTETVSLGWFGIEDTEITDDGSGVGVRVTGLDRAERLSKAKFEDTFQVLSGTPFPEAILDLAQAVWVDVPYDPDLLSASAISIGRNITAQPGDDRWEFMQGLATALGMTLFFDGDGQLCLRRYAPDGVVAEVTDGEDGVLVSVSRAWSRTTAFNRVIVTGENTDTAVFRGVATDDNPASPTYFYGPFGQVPRFWSSPDIYSDDQAEDAARSILDQEIGTAATVQFGMVPNPALEPEDTVHVRRTVAGVDENHVLDQVTIGLGATEEMSCQTRERLVR